ncbi:MAG: AAA family ATPase [Planctomycetota bacterium]|jgi:predicted ATP-dependent endonuclease of OLD family
MEIKSFRIENYRSVKNLEINKLGPINVFFGKNNVGKSNILRALHLAFYCLKHGSVFLPDTMFFNRNIFKPIEISMDLDLGRRFKRADKLDVELDKALENFRSGLSSLEDAVGDITSEAEKFMDATASFKPLRCLLLKTRIGYGEEKSDIALIIKAPESEYRFNYSAYMLSYQRLLSHINDKIRSERARRLEELLNYFSRQGIRPRSLLGPFYSRRITEYTFDEVEVERIMARLDQAIEETEENETRRNISSALEHYRDSIMMPYPEATKAISNVFNIVKQYFDMISDSFVLIPNKEYFLRGPFAQKDGERIQLLNMERFMDRLSSLIESPTKRDRGLIDKFFTVFNQSYSDLGQLENVTKLRDRVFVIFGTSLTSLPIDDQGLGAQDLFLYLAHMVLFDTTVLAIEEPEGGLSVENQRALRTIIKRLYLKRRRPSQIFISSHSEEFELPNSYVIEIGKAGTKEVSRLEKEAEYEEKIDKILLNRNLEHEKAQLETLLSQVAQRQMTLDVLQYIDKLSDEEPIDTQEISDKFGYPKEKVEEILKEAARKK